MGNKLFRGLHLLAVFCVIQYAVVRAFTWARLGIAPNAWDYLIWGCVMYVGVLEPGIGFLDKRRERIRSSLEYHVSQLAARVQFEAPDSEAAFKAMITRLATEHGLLPEAGWAETIEVIVFRLTYRWGSHAAGGLHLHTKLEECGIHFDLDQTERFDRTLAEMIERHGPPLPFLADPDRHRYNLVRVYLVSALNALSGMSHALGSEKSLIQNILPEDFALAIDLYCMDPRVNDMTWRWYVGEEGNEDEMVGAGELFWVLQHCRHIGIDPKSLRRYLGYHGSFSFVALEELLLLNAMNARVLQEITEHPKTFDGVLY
jgi:hypothetical protein